MTQQPAHPHDGYLLLADISGYTAFLTSTELEHSHARQAFGEDRRLESWRYLYEALLRLCPAGTGGLRGRVSRGGARCGQQ